MTLIKSPSNVLDTTATLYGKVIEAGGENPPRARVQFPDGTELTCNVTTEHSYQVARTLGSRLYETVKLAGRA